MNVYNSEFCHETLLTLKYEFSLDEFLKLSEYVDIASSYKHEQEEKLKKQQRRGR